MAVRGLTHDSGFAGSDELVIGKQPPGRTSQRRRHEKTPGGRWCCCSHHIAVNFLFLVTKGDEDENLDWDEMVAVGVFMENKAMGIKR